MAKKKTTARREGTATGIRKLKGVAKEKIGADKIDRRNIEENGSGDKNEGVISGDFVGYA